MKSGAVVFFFDRNLSLHSPLQAENPAIWDFMMREE